MHFGMQYSIANTAGHVCFISRKYPPIPLQWINARIEIKFYKNIILIELQRVSMQPCPIQIS